MSGFQSVLWLLSNLKPLVPSVIFVSSMTLIALAALSVIVTSSWVRNREFTVAGLFFGLNGKGMLQLSCSWLKLLFTFWFLAAFRQMELIQYIVLLLPGLVLALTLPSLQKLAGLFWWILQAAGMFSINSVCGYILEVHAGVVFVLVYIALALFMALFSIYLFLTDVDMISENRRVNPGKIWGEENLSGRAK